MSASRKPTLALVETPKCHCGRPLRHTGRCIGGPAKLGDGKIAGKLASLVNLEITATHAEIARLQTEIAERSRAMHAAKAKLAPLTALADTYKVKAISGPADTPTALPDDADDDDPWPAVRSRVLEREWRKNTSIRTIRAMLDDLPGSALNDREIIRYAEQNLGLPKRSHYA